MSDAVLFLEEELAGVQGVRWEELAGRFEGEEKDLRAALEGIGETVREVDGWYVMWLPWPKLDIGNALRRLIGYPEWAETLLGFCEHSAERLIAQAWQFRDELVSRGNPQDLADVEIALVELAAELLPDSPAGQEGDEHLRRVMGKRCFEYIDSRHGRWGEHLKPQRDEVDRAWFEGTLADLRAALREFALAAVRGVEGAA
jgi:hypothetical protein